MIALCKEGVKIWKSLGMVKTKPSKVLTVLITIA